MTRYAVMGAGAWGTALALQGVRAGLDVTLWGHLPTHIDALKRDQENREFLPGVPLPESLNLTSDLALALKDADAIMLVVPSSAFIEVLDRIDDILGDKRLPVVWATKGLVSPSNTFLHEAIWARWGKSHPCAVLSGPSFAAELARAKPTAVTLAGSDVAFVKQVQQAWHTTNFRLYPSDDLVGVQLGGVMKNVLAIAVGISDARELGANAKAALITRGLAEMRRLSEAVGASSETLMGLSGLGDLVLTCTDNQSRNRRLGLALGQGLSLAQAQAEIGQALEGNSNAKALYGMAQQHGVSMPICEQVYAIFHDNQSAELAIEQLVARQLPDSE